MNDRLDNYDVRIPYYKLRLYRENFLNLPEMVLPDGYHFEFYHPGDKEAWIEIETSSKECGTYEDACKAWDTYFLPWEHELSQRMLFVVNESGMKVGTASAYFDIHGLDPKNSGRLHWVAIHRDYQGKGLSRALLSEVMKVMRTLNVSCAFCNTSSRNWVACKLYLDLGFVPYQLQESVTGWRIIKTLTNHPALEHLQVLDITELLKEK